MLTLFGPTHRTRTHAIIKAPQISSSLREEGSNGLKHISDRFEGFVDFDLTAAPTHWISCKVKPEIETWGTPLAETERVRRTLFQARRHLKLASGIRNCSRGSINLQAVLVVFMWVFKVNVT